MPAWLAAAGAAAIPGIASVIGGERGNRARRKEAERNRSFQERMRNTAWQAAVEDMRAAGLNPALAYGQGPAASPGGSMASQEDTVTPAVSSAMQAKRLQADLKLIRAQVSEQVAKARVAQNEQWWSDARTDYYREGKYDKSGIGGRSMSDIKRDRREKFLDAEFNYRIANTAREQGMASITGLGGEAAAGFQEFMPAYRDIMRVGGQGAQQLAEVIGVLERAARMRDRAVQAYLGVPKQVIVNLLNRMKRNRTKGR